MPLNPMQVFSYINLKPTDYVADLGCGSGYFTIPLSRIVKEGKVYAIEIQKEILNRLQNDIRQLGISNIETIWGDIEIEGGTQLDSESVDATFIFNTLFQVEDKIGLIREATRITKRGGKIFVIDWKDSFGGIGPHPSQIISSQEVKTLFNELGLILEKEIDFEKHYGLIFKK